MTLLHTLISLSLLFLIWQFMWKATMHDIFKDKLDDLYNETHTWINNKQLISHDAGKALLEYLDFCRKNLSNITFFRLLSFSIEYAFQTRKVQTSINEFENRFKTPNKQFRRKIEKVREATSVCVVQHLIFANPLLLVFLLIVTVFVAPLCLFTRSSVNAYSNVKQVIKNNTVKHHLDKKIENLSLHCC